MMARKKSTLQKILQYAFILSGMLFMVSCNGNGDENGKEYTKLVKAAKAVKITSERNEQFPGIIEESDQVNLAFRVAGPIKKIYVKEGQFVKAGQLVAKMDTRDYEVQKNAIETQVLQLQSEYKRIAELKERGSVAANDYEKMKAGKEMAEQKLKNAKDQLKDTKLVAPFSGYITKVNFEEGELVNHGTPIASLIDVSALKVEISVPASLYIKKDRITNIYCTQDDLPGNTFPLTLKADNIKANNNGLFKFYLHYKPEGKTKLIPGMNVLVDITYDSGTKEMLSIPVSAVFEKDGESYVWLIKDSVVTRNKVTTNNQIKGGQLMILSGLKAGDEVVSGGLNLLNEGEAVRVIAPPSATNIGGLN